MKNERKAPGKGAFFMPKTSIGGERKVGFATRLDNIIGTIAPQAALKRVVARQKMQILK